MKDYKTDKSWGMIGAYRCQGNSTDFFQSDIPCNNHICIRIKTAQLHRDLNRDWVMGDKLLVSVKLTPMQWAEMLTNMNSGDGVPCTIEYTKEDNYIEFNPESNRLDLILEESDDSVDFGKEKIQTTIDKIRDLCKNKKITKTVADELILELGCANSYLGGSHTEFIKNQAKEQIGNMVVQAKANISAYIDHKIYSTGIQELERLKLNGGETK